MSPSDQPRVVRRYLSELTSALAGVPREIATEIEDGVAEELAGLNASDAATRILELGDPAFIAAEAQANVESDPMMEAPTQNSQTYSSSATQPAEPATETRWFIVVASLLVALGGVVIPVLGWVAGIVMVWMSKKWRTWEKLVGTLIPLGLVGLLVLGSVAISLFAQPAVSQPGMSSGFSGWHAVILFVFFSPFIAGMWLLWRGLRSNDATVR